MFKYLELANPEFLFLILLLPVVAWWYYGRYRTHYASITMSNIAMFKGQSSWRGRARALLPILRGLAFICLVVALARPQTLLSEENVEANGIDIMLAVDLSSSMLAQDFEPDRLLVAKRVAADFVEKREFDRIGLVVFSGEAYTQCPLTTDHKVVQDFLENLQSGLLQDGTAIGMGLATAVNRLRESEARSKVVILMTDGDNNAGAIAPITAAEIAQSFGIRVYTIGVGTIGRAKSPVAMYPDGTYKYEMADVKIDEETMKSIAAMTEAEYFRATDGNALSRIFSEIDRLEKTKISVTEHRQKSEEYYWFLVVGAVLLLAEFLFRQLFLQTLP